MYKYNLDNIINNIYSTIIWNIELYSPKIIWALIIICIWFFISLFIHKFVMYLFKRFNIIKLVDKLTIELINNIKKEDPIDNEQALVDEQKPKRIKRKKISDTIKINEITAKAFSYYIFLVFFRLSIIVIWIKEVEDFLWELITYLPSLFIWVVIWFFWIRFANFINDVVFHALDLTNQKTAKIIASGAKIIILFFTLMFVLDKIWIASDITNTIVIGFVSMVSLAWGLAFWLGWKDIAHEILESFKK